MGNMYAEAKTWSPFVGCKFDCTYCGPSFQAQAKRQRQRCSTCYYYAPHEHAERLKRIPAAPIVFVCAYGDIAFASEPYRQRIARAMLDHARGRVRRMVDPVTYYLQSKAPGSLKGMLPVIPRSSTLVTTLETNRIGGYCHISKAPDPQARWLQFCLLDWHSKVLTLEPLLAFDTEPFAEMIVAANPEYVWLGFNSKPKQVRLPEPSESDVIGLIAKLRKAGIAIRGKELRGIRI